MNTKMKRRSQTFVNITYKCEFTSFSKSSWFKWEKIFPMNFIKMGGISNDVKNKATINESH